MFRTARPGGLQRPRGFTRPGGFIFHGRLPRPRSRDWRPHRRQRGGGPGTQPLRLGAVSRRPGKPAPQGQVLRSFESENSVNLLSNSWWRGNSCILVISEFQEPSWLQNPQVSQRTGQRLLASAALVTSPPSRSRIYCKQQEG